MSYPPPQEPRGAARLRYLITVAAVRSGGWPFPTRYMDRLRDLAIFAMGIGSAALKPKDSGELTVLRRLASRWSARDEVTVLDVGAHVGDYALLARSAFGPKARIHCFEPNPALFEESRSRLAGDAHIFCHQLALGGESGSAPLFLDAAGSSRGSLVQDTFGVTGRPVEATQEVAVKTLDEVARDLGLGSIDLLKLDVEGHELAVLKGAADLLAGSRIRAIQFEFGERNLASRTYLRDFFELLGPTFRFFRVTPRGPVPITYRPKIETFALETNYLAVSNETMGLSG